METILARLARLEERADLALRAQVLTACAALRVDYEARVGDGFSYLVSAAVDGVCTVECFEHEDLASDIAAGLSRFGLTCDDEIDMSAPSGLYTVYTLSVRYLEVSV